LGAEKLKARKMLKNAAESPASGARFVGQFFDLRLTFAIFQNRVAQKWLILDFLLHR
jgi:hypothetical protein